MSLLSPFFLITSTEYSKEYICFYTQNHRKIRSRRNGLTRTAFFSFALLLLWGTLNARLLLHYVTFSFMNRSSAFHPRKCINKYHAYHTKKKCIQVKALVRKLFFPCPSITEKGVLTLSLWKYIAVFVYKRPNEKGLFSNFD